MKEMNTNIQANHFSLEPLKTNTEMKSLHITYPSNMKVAPPF